MPGIPGNAYTLSVGKQTAKGTANTTGLYKKKVTGGGMDAGREFVQLEETDASRQQGASIAVGASVTGSPSYYLRPDEFGFAAYAALGATAMSGAGADKTHTATPASSTPYFTLIEAYNTSTLINQFKDSVCTGLHISGSAGGVIEYTEDWTSLSYLGGGADTALAVPTQQPIVYPEVTVTRGGAAPLTVEDFSIDIENGGDVLQGDGAMLPYDYVWGKLEVSGSMTMLFENDQDYRRFLTGSTSGTAFTTTIASQTLSINCVRSAILGVEFVFAGVVLSGYDISPDPGGDPIRASIEWYSNPQAAIADYISIKTKNQVATTYSA